MSRRDRPDLARASSGCKVFLNKDEVEIGQLGTRVGEVFKNRKTSDKILFLAAEEKLNYEAIVRILDQARKGDESVKVGIVSDERLAHPQAAAAAAPTGLALGAPGGLGLTRRSRSRRRRQRGRPR